MASALGRGRQSRDSHGGSGKGATSADIQANLNSMQSLNIREGKNGVSEGCLPACLPACLPVRLRFF